MLRAVLAAAVATFALAAPAVADWSGDGAADVLAVRSDGALLLYPSTGRGAFQPNGPQVIGSGWASSTRC